MLILTNSHLFVYCTRGAEHLTAGVLYYDYAGSSVDIVAIYLGLKRYFFLNYFLKFI